MVERPRRRKREALDSVMSMSAVAHSVAPTAKHMAAASVVTNPNTSTHVPIASDSAASAAENTELCRWRSRRTVERTQQMQQPIRSGLLRDGSPPPHSRASAGRRKSTRVASSDMTLVSARYSMPGSSHRSE